MRDRREEVLARLHAIMAGIPGLRAVRNQKDVTGRAAATVALFDGDETAVLQDDSNCSPHKPVMVDMLPGIVLLMGDVAPTIGASLNNFRALIIYAVMTDDELQGIIGPNGFVKYETLSNELDRGRTMTAQYDMNFRIRYPLFISELS
jgi:hypothetical protein